MFGVYCLCRILVLNVRLPGKVHQAPREKTMKLSTSEVMKWTWLQEAQWLNHESRKLRGPRQKCWSLRVKKPYPNCRETDTKGPHTEGWRFQKTREAAPTKEAANWARKGPCRSAQANRLLTVYFGAPSMFITLWFGFDYGTNPPLGTLII
jgi:hypothetical protein